MTFEELSKILSSPNFKKGINLLKETKVDCAIGLTCEDMVYTPDLLGMWSQLEITKINFTNTEKENIAKVKQLLRINKIGNFELFNYGLYLCLVAGQILNISYQNINKMYKNLPIKSMKDIDINGSEIMDILNIGPSHQISDIIKNIKVQLLCGQLKNKKSELKKYIIKEWHHE
jgi:tRNA nucleotidyltransferase/poly(A) polymerase